MFSSFGRLPEGSRTDSGGSGVPPEPDFAKILRCFFAGSAGVVVCRVPPECCRDAPPVSGTHSAGFPWGTAISRSELNSPGHRPSGVLDNELLVIG